MFFSTLYAMTSAHSVLNDSSHTASTGEPAATIRPAPTAYDDFTGHVGRVFATSESGWKEPARPPQGAPNIVFMLCDDLGYSDLGCYGSEISTPNIDALSTSGLRFTDYHSTPMCSPTRAAFLTGLEPHRAGVGHVAHSDPGFPGYAMELTHDAPTLAEVLRSNGYQTLMVGKWHLTKDSEVNDAGDRSSWPLQRGFDRYYGFLDAFTNFHHPHRLIEDNHALRIDEFPDDYYFTDDATSRAISMIRESKASNPQKPFFMYFAHAAVHAPLHAKASDMEKYRGMYDAGWDEIRAQRFARQQELGVVARGAELAPRNTEPGDDVPPWDDLDDDRKRLFARYMEVYAAMVDNIDQNVGRLRAALEEMGEWDNTLFIFTSDNGGSREGEADGTSAYFRSLQFVKTGEPEPFEEDLARIDELGGPTTMPHYPRGWAMASNTPFRLYKINAHRGGHSVPFVAHWPTNIPDPGSIRDQFVHITDMFPTLLNIVGVERPHEWNGRQPIPLAGENVEAVLTNASAPGREVDLLIENEGHRGLRRGNYVVVSRHEPRTPFSQDVWELFDLDEDPTELNDLAEKFPELHQELIDAWEQGAWDNQVFPLDEGTGYRYLLRPPWVEVYDEPVTLFRDMGTLDRWRSQRLILWRDVDITAHVEISDRDGQLDSGVLFAHGDQGGGYNLVIDTNGELLATHNGYGLVTEIRGPKVAPGEHHIGLDIRCPGNNKWDLAVRINGEVVAEATGLRLLMAMAPFQGIDVGIDRRSPVNWSLYQQHRSFPFTGTIHSVKYQPGAPAPDSPTEFLDMLRDWGKTFE